jgi:hypothetical protein
MKKTANKEKRSNIFLVLAVYNYEMFQRDKKIEGVDLNGIWREWGKLV